MSALVTALIKKRDIFEKKPAAHHPTTLLRVMTEYSYTTNPSSLPSSGYSGANPSAEETRRAHPE
jgi:hypothetical protein